jgi:hypothetical protein
MKIEVVKHPKTDLNEVFIDGLKVGVFEQMDSQSNRYSFASTCSNEKLTGDHYIVIGQHLNNLNNMVA